MNRFIIGQAGVFALLALLAGGCAAEETTHEWGAGQTAEGARIVGIGSDGEELPSTVDPSPSSNRKHLADPAKSSCPGCGPVPDPWKSIVGPVPDPWQTDSSPDAPPAKDSSGTSGTGTNGSNRKP